MIFKITLTLIVIALTIYMVKYTETEKKYAAEDIYPADWFACSGGCDNCDKDCIDKIETKAIERYHKDCLFYDADDYDSSPICAYHKIYGKFDCLYCEDYIKSGDNNNE